MVVIDLFSRKVVGWSIRPDMHRSRIIDALKMGLFQGRLAKGELTFHSNRGSQCGSEDFRLVLNQPAIAPSMRRRGKCWDNAVTETLLASLKLEWLPGKHFPTIREAKYMVFDWLL